MFFYNLVASHPLVALIVIELLLVFVGQFWTLARIGIERGFGRVVTLAGFYGDMALGGAIVVISSILHEQGFAPEWEGWLWAVSIVLYVVSVIVAQKFIPPPRVEDLYHNFFVLPIFVILFVVGIIFCVLSFTEHGFDHRFWWVIAAVLFWFILLLVDIHYGRLDQEGFMKKHWNVTM